MAKKPSKPMLIVLAAAFVTSILLVAAVVVSPLPRLIWNASPSVPVGLYWIEFRQPNRSEIAVLKLREWAQMIADQRNYMPSIAWLMKPIFATSGAIVCRFGSLTFVDGRLIAKALLQDTMHRPMPVWKGCRKLSDTEVFLLSQHRGSFDSRYFGPVDRALIIGTAKRLF